MATVEVSSAVEAFGLHRLLAAKARKLGRADEAAAHEEAAREYMRTAEQERVAEIVERASKALAEQGITRENVVEAIKLRSDGNPVCSKSGRKKAGKKIELLHNFLDLAQEK